MSVLITGGRGMLARALARELGEKAVLVGKDRCDVRDVSAVAEVIGHVKPSVVVHAAAYTDVDGCERDESLARDVNVAGTRNVAEVAASRNARLIMISTDYVFGGGASEPLTEEDLTGPVCAYGRSKLGAEGAAIIHHPETTIVRLSALYGPGGKHFPGAIMGRIARNEPLEVVDDQTVSPSYVDDVAAAIARLVNRPESRGVFHCANEGAVTWHKVAEEMLSLLGKPDYPLRAVSSGKLGRAARRPTYSALDSMKIQTTLGFVLRGWAPALKAFHEASGGKFA